MKFDNVGLTMVDGDLEAGLIPFLLGEPGIGKSSWVMSLAQRHSTKVFVLPCNQLADKADLTGARLVPVDGKPGEYAQVFYPHSVIEEAILYAEDHPRENPILFMDELNRTTPDVTSACLSIPTMRKIGNKSLPKNLRIICAGNDKGNITSLDEASISRFVLYRVNPDLDTYLGLDQNLNPFVKQVLTAHPETLFCKKIRTSAGAGVSNGYDSNDDEDDGISIDDIVDDAEEMNQITTPRTITGVSDWLNRFSNDQLLDMLTDTHTEEGQEISALQEALEGHTGATSFTAFLLETIATGISTVNNQSNTIKLTEPKAYNGMKQCSDIAALDAYVAGMTDTEQADCLMYALYEHKDNAVYIQHLAPNVQQFSSDELKTLMSLASNDMLDDSNKDALMKTNAPIASTLSLILSI